MPKTLSGGERAKLGLAMLAAGRANVLLLDEPTNNLDPSSIEAVGTMLSRWPGTIVVVSHDRSFVQALAPTHCLKLPDEVFTHWDERLPRPGGDEVGHRLLTVLQRTVLLLPVPTRVAEGWEPFRST